MMMERWLPIFLVIVSLEIALCAATPCDEAYEAAHRAYYSAGKRYMSIDKFYLTHGKPCYDKCNAFGKYYKSSQNSECTEGTCPVKVFNRKRRHTRPDQCKRAAASDECDPLYPYRKIDGHCNNLKYPDWGKSVTAQRRLVPNDYDDGQGSSRTTGRHGTLRSARAISNIVHKAGTVMKTERKLTLMLMQIGQLVTHDVILSKMQTRDDGEPLECCGEDENDIGCDPIKIPIDDPFFERGGCMNFPRTIDETDCNGINQQMNDHTSYVDISLLYGRTDAQSAEIRTFIGGLLVSVNNKLPVDLDDKTCDLSRPRDLTEYYCARSGDPRAHENPCLASLHTIFLREHNRLAEGLANVNPGWDDERLFQEARKINIAQWQNIVYQEYLPIIINPYLRRKLDLNIRSSGYKDTYNPKVDASIINAFGAAAFRFGHSQIPRDIPLVGYSHENIRPPDPLKNNFFEPYLYHKYQGRGLEYLLLGAVVTKCPLLDRELEDSVQKFLFQDPEKDSFDLAALNIHRGRDHGLPGYNAYRRVCGLSKVKHFGTSRGGLVDHSPEDAALLEQAYACPDDIDLFTALISEKRGKRSILGRTTECIIAIQFNRLRDGDRFFFERRDPINPAIGFTPEQLDVIKKVKLSTLLCLNTDAVQIQENVLMVPGKRSKWCPRNDKIPCSVLRQCQVDFTLWRE